VYFIYFSILIVNCSRIRVTNLLLHDPEDVVLYYVVADPPSFFVDTVLDGGREQTSSTAWAMARFGRNSRNRATMLQ